MFPALYVNPHRPRSAQGVQNILTCYKKTIKIHVWIHKHLLHIHGGCHDNTTLELEYWQSQEGPRRALCKFAGAMFKLYQSRSNLTVKVTCLKSMVPLERYGHMEYIIMPNMNTKSVTVRKLWPMLKSRSKVTIKVTCSKFIVPPESSCYKGHTCQKWKPFLLG